VVPRDEIDHWFECPPDLMNHLMEVSQHIARAQQRAFQPVRVGLMVAGLEVPHLHLHLVPMDGVRDLDFANAATSVEREDLEDAAGSIRDVLRSVGSPGVVD